MKVKRFAHIRLPTAYSITLSLILMMTSCVEEWSEDYCPCQQGGVIGGWEDGGETDVNHKDSTAGFEVSLEHWNDTCKNDIVL